MVTYRNRDIVLDYFNKPRLKYAAWFGLVTMSFVWFYFLSFSILGVLFYLDTCLSALPPCVSPLITFQNVSTCV